MTPKEILIIQSKFHKYNKYNYGDIIRHISLFLKILNIDKQVINNHVNCIQHIKDVLTISEGVYELSMIKISNIYFNEIWKLHLRSEEYLDLVGYELYGPSYFRYPQKKRIKYTTNKIRNKIRNKIKNKNKNKNKLFN